MHLKRQESPKNWPVKRKGTVYIVRPNSDTKKGIPVLVVLRDILKLAQNRKEAKSAIHSKKVLLNGRAIKDEKTPMLLFDVMAIVQSKKNYRLLVSTTGKFELREIKDLEAKYKIAKILNKKMLKGKKIQLNLNDGRNLVSKNRQNIGDSVVLNLKERKVERIIPMQEKAKVIIFEGKHAGKEGVIKSIISKNKMAEINVKDGSINVLTKQLIVIE